MSLSVVFLVFPQIQQLDLTGPYEVLAALPGATVRLAWKNVEPVTSKSGLVLVPTATFADCPAADVLCVPGGDGVDALLADAEVLDFLRREATGARFVTSVCTGALLLGAAGLLAGRRATTHWRSRDLLPLLGAVPAEGRVVRDGNLFTAGGVTAGIDFALTIAAELAGRPVAEAIQLGLEYAPAPPFAAGNPESVPPGVLSAVKARTAAGRARREAAVRAAAAALGTGR